MKIVQITYSKHRGGASKACYRIHKALRKNNVDSNMLTCLPSNPEEVSVQCFSNSLFRQAERKLKKIFNLLIVSSLQKSTNLDLHTFDFNSVLKSKTINKTDADIIHLHWINYSMIGIKSLRKINKPIVWTFHDMWPFMGCEHYDNLNSPSRYIQGYTYSNKNVKGLDLNRMAWKMKRKYWQGIDFQIVVPSKWLKNCVKNSALLKDFKVEVIPYIIEEDKFFPLDKQDARRNLSLPLDKKLILFGAFDAKNLNKGGDLLYAALENLSIENTELIIFGAKNGPNIQGIKTTYLGYIRDEKILNYLYNSADLMAVPSRQDNLPNTVLESICCGTPVVGFNIGGLPDMVVHKRNGYLAEPYNIDDLKTGIEYVLENTEKINFLNNCRTHFENNFSEKIVIPKIINLYKKILDKN